MAEKEDLKKDKEENTGEKAEIRSNIPEALNDCCKECMKWQKFGDKCWAHWDGKKECSQKVKDIDEWEYEKMLFR